MRPMRELMCIIVACWAGPAGIALGTSNIDPTDKYSWCETTGWMNWLDADGGTEGVFVDTANGYLSGFVWGENGGWLNLGDGNGPYVNATGLDFGVNIEPNGDLDGFGWSETGGWVNFGWAANTANTDRARFDAGADRFRGWAWAENDGWVNLDDGSHFVGVEPSASDPPLMPPSPHDYRKNRFVSFVPNNAGAVAFRVELLDLGCSVTGKKCSFASDCEACVGGANANLSCFSDSDCPGGNCQVIGETCDEQSPPAVLGWLSDPAADPGDSPAGTFVSTVDAVQPAARVWTEPVVHVGDCEIAPVQTYGLRSTADGASFSDALVLATIQQPEGKFWADLVGSFNGIEWSAPNVLVNVDDVSSMIKYITLKPAPHITVVDLVGSPDSYVNLLINAGDLQMVIKGFTGKTYPPIAYVGYPAELTDCP